MREELIGHFVQLLKDNEAEVRTAAAGQVPGMCHYFVSDHLRSFPELLYRLFEAA